MDRTDYQILNLLWTYSRAALASAGILMRYYNDENYLQTVWVPSNH